MMASVPSVTRREPGLPELAPEFPLVRDFKQEESLPLRVSPERCRNATVACGALRWRPGFAVWSLPWLVRRCEAGAVGRAAPHVAPCALFKLTLRFTTGCCSLVTHTWRLLGWNCELCFRKIQLFAGYLAERGWGLGGARALAQTLVLPW